MRTHKFGKMSAQARPRGGRGGAREVSGGAGVAARRKKERGDHDVGHFRRQRGQGLGQQRPVESGGYRS